MVDNGHQTVDIHNGQHGNLAFGLLERDATQGAHNGLTPEHVLAEHHASFCSLR